MSGRGGDSVTGYLNTLSRRREDQLSLVKKWHSLILVERRECVEFYGLYCDLVFVYEVALFYLTLSVSE